MPQEITPVEVCEGVGFRSTALKILIVDDENISRLILAKFLAKNGHVTFTAKDGKEGVALFEKENPDLVIMDIMMPVMDGYEATRMIKEKAGESFIPIICLTSLEDEEGLARCIEAGADDFLSKPITPTILNAKIDSMMRICALYETVRKQKNALMDLIAEKDLEMTFAEKIYSQIVNRGKVNEKNIRYWTSPMAIFSGDILLMACDPSGRINVIMGDFTGHGLSAAMGAIPASEMFYAMTAKGCSTNEIAMELNRKLKSLLPSNIFLAAGLLQIDKDGRTVTVWSGAIPDIFIIGKEKGIKRRIKSRNLPLGVVNNDMLGSTVELVSLADGERLCIFSDGITEAVRSDGEMFGEARLEKCLNEHCGESLLADVRKAIDLFCGSETQHDDVTMLEIICDTHVSTRSEITPSPSFEELDPLNWIIVVDLAPNRFQDMDPLPMIMQILTQDSALGMHKENLFLIISELFTNALDHGVLGMDGSLKQDVEGMLQYLEEREKALAAVETGFIQIECEHKVEQGNRLIVVKVEDSGPGFDFCKRDTCLPESSVMGGRGITLVHSLCREVVFHGKGNRVEATYVIERNG